jgi:hypothetical protein
MRAMNQIQITTFNLQVTSPETSPQTNFKSQRLKKGQALQKTPKTLKPASRGSVQIPTPMSQSNSNPQGANADQTLEKESIP